MKITAVEAVPVCRYLFTRVHTDSGIVGYGESGARLGVDGSVVDQ